MSSPVHSFNHDVCTVYAVIVMSVAVIMVGVVIWFDECIILYIIYYMNSFWQL